MFYYKIYDLIIKCNQKLHILKEAKPSLEYVEVNILSPIENYQYEGKIKKEHEYYSLVLMHNLKYKVYIKDKLIVCYCDNIEMFLSTFFNIPLSIYYTINKKVLFHACTMIDNNIAYAFAAEKGTGKSTLTTLLNSDDLKLFSDDTILIDRNLNIYRAHNYIKYTQQTINEIQTCKLIDYQNLAGKKYGIINTNICIPKLDCIFILSRATECRVFQLKNEHIKKVLFYNNIVGIAWFDYSLLRMIDDLFINVDYFKLFIPNNITSLKENKEKLMEIIKLKGKVKE